MYYAHIFFSIVNNDNNFTVKISYNYIIFVYFITLSLTYKCVTFNRNGPPKMYNMLSTTRCSNKNEISFE